MSSYLLDTNAFAMALTDDPRLPGGVRQRMQRATRLLVSAISLYEIGQKVRLGKWPEMGPHVEALAARARDDGYDLLPLTPDMALASAMLDWAHRDPFDRIIGTVALHEGLPLLSSNIAFDDLPLERCWT